MNVGIIFIDFGKMYLTNEFDDLIVFTVLLLQLQFIIKINYSCYETA